MSVNLRRIDLNLLPVFEAVYEERSLSRAAVRLAMTQSAVSHALTRLRALYKDELFVRQPHGVMPTTTALVIYGKLRAALPEIRESLTESHGFDAATSTRRFVLAIPHPLGYLMLLHLRKRLARTAPKIVVSLTTRSPSVAMERRLSDDRVDMTIDWFLPRGEQFMEKRLFSDGLTVVARAGHRILRDPKPRQALRTSEFVRMRTTVPKETHPEGMRMWEWINPLVVLEMAQILESLMIASQSDLLTLAPICMLGVARKQFDLRSVQWTPRGPKIPVSLIWHASRNGDEAHAFLRTQLKEAIGEALAEAKG